MQVMSGIAIASRAARRSPNESAAMHAANAADRSSRNLGAARPVASRPRCRESVSRSRQAQRQRSCFGAPRRPQQELQARIGDDIGGSEIEARQPNAAFGTFFQPGETEVNLLALFFRLVGGEWRAEKDRADEALAGRPEIGDELRDTLKNPASFLGSAPE